MKRYLWILALPVLGAAQIAPVDVAAPTLGYVWEERSHALYPVEGVPGSATLGSPVNLGFAADRIAVAPGRRFAIGRPQGGGKPLTIRLDGAIGAVFVSEVPEGEVFFAPSADTVAVALGERIEVWGGLLNQAQRRQSFSIDGLSVKRVFVSDDGNRVLALAGGGLYSLNTEGPAELVGEGYLDLAFLKNSQDAVAIHAERGVVLLRKVEAQSEETVGGAVADALAVAISADEKTIAVLRSGSVVLIDRQSQQSSEIILDAIAAGGIRRAEGNAVFQLDAAGNDVWYVDADAGTARLVRVSKGENQ